MAERTDKQITYSIAIATVIGALISFAGSDGGDRHWAIPVFAICGALAFAVNWAAFIPAAIKQTEHYYDLTGGITYITVIVVAVLLSSPLDLRAAIVTGMVMFWSIRLASFLFMRISRAGKDSRFDKIKNQPLRFFLAWTLQGLWVLLTAACALAPSVEALIAARAVQGAAAAAMVPGSLAIISKTYPRQERGRAIGIWAAASALLAP